MIAREAEEIVSPRVGLRSAGFDRLTGEIGILEAAEADYSSATAQLRASAFIRRRGDPILRT